LSDCISNWHRWDVTANCFNDEAVNKKSTWILRCSNGSGAVSMREAVEKDLAELDTEAQAKISKLNRTNDVHKVTMTAV
jgi:hypothetical protein